MRGPNVFVEYWGNAKATAEALREGWYHTGDIGTRDADGHFFIHDRKSNLIISGGENVYPAEVERVLHAASGGRRSRGRSAGRMRNGRRCRLPASCGAAGAPLMPPISSASASTRLARYKVPRKYVFLDSLPRNALGKVQHFRLKERIANQGLVIQESGVKSDKAAL